ncbi:MAG TPA: GAF domain-containing sensor histidine kinase, partial [Acidimicrobiia bacterium]
TDPTGLRRLAPLIAEAASVEGEVDLGRILRTLVAEVQTATGAPYVALGVIGEHQVLSDFVYEGISKEQADKIGKLPTGHGVLGTVIRENQTIILERISDHPDSIGFPEHHPSMEAFLGVPITVGGDPFGNLYLTDKEDGFTDEDIATVEAISRVAGAAIQTAGLQTRLRHMAVVEDRNRIARDLHDSVIQDIFAVGLSLQGLSNRASEPEMSEQLDSSIDTLDRVVNTLRRYIFELREGVVPAAGLDDKIQALVARMGSAYPTKVELFVEPMDSYPSDEELVLLLTEALSNALRHADAAKITVDVAQQDEDIVVRITDDGVGFDPAEVEAGMGLANMRARALGLDGTLELRSGPGEGTTVIARIPIRSLQSRR